MKRYLFMLLLPLLIGCQCNKGENCHKTITFVNNDTIDVYVLGLETVEDSVIHYALPGEKVNSEAESKTALSLRDCYEYRLSNTDKVWVIVSDVKLVNDSTWDYVSDNKRFLKQYFLTLEDLQNMNWTVTYP